VQFHYVREHLLNHDPKYKMKYGNDSIKIKTNKMRSENKLKIK
jgi:hypothetical protein